MLFPPGFPAPHSPQRRWGGTGPGAGRARAGVRQRLPGVRRAATQACHALLRRARHRHFCRHAIHCSAQFRFHRHCFTNVPPRSPLSLPFALIIAIPAAGCIRRLFAGLPLIPGCRYFASRTVPLIIYCRRRNAHGSTNRQLLQYIAAPLLASRHGSLIRLHQFNFQSNTTFAASNRGAARRYFAICFAGPAQALPLAIRLPLCYSSFRQVSGLARPGAAGRPPGLAIQLLMAGLQSGIPASAGPAFNFINCRSAAAFIASARAPRRSAAIRQFHSGRAQLHSPIFAFRQLYNCAAIAANYLSFAFALFSFRSAYSAITPGSAYSRPSVRRRIPHQFAAAIPASRYSSPQLSIIPGMLVCRRRHRFRSIAHAQAALHWQPGITPGSFPLRRPLPLSG